MERIFLIMEKYKNVPLHAAAYKLSLEIFRIKIKLPKSLKSDLGGQTFKLSLEIVQYLVMANGSQNSEEKMNHLRQIILREECLWVLFRILFDCKGISQGEFRVLSEKLVSVEKQTVAWLKWLSSQKSKDSSVSLKSNPQKTSNQAKNLSP